MLEPFKQGDDNGLCGLTSVTNAIRWLFPELTKKAKDGYTETKIVDFRRHLVKSLKPKEFVRLYLDGNELPVMRSLMIAAIKWIDENTNSRLDVHIPYSNKRHPATKKDYWDEVLDFIEPKNKVAIIGFNQPWDHWTVATNRVTRFSVRLFDSDVFDTIDMRQTVIGKTNGRTVEIEPTAVIVVGRVKK
jgi:hypothetical protein